MAIPYEFQNIPESALNRYPENINPLLPTYYRFYISRLPNVSYFCQSASLPTVTVTEIQFSNPFVPIKQPSKMDFDDLSLTFIVDENMDNWRELFGWMRSITNVENFSEFQHPKTHFSTASLIILNSAKQPKINVRFDGLYPKTLGSVDFTSTVIDPEPFQCTATFAYRSYSIEIL